MTHHKFDNKFFFIAMVFFFLEKPIFFSSFAYQSYQIAHQIEPQKHTYLNNALEIAMTLAFLFVEMSTTIKNKLASRLYLIRMLSICF